MRVFCALIFTVGLLFGSENIQSFLKTLPKEDVLTLDWFFRNCFRSFGGYVLCGNKPMCIEEIPKSPISLNHNEWIYAKINAFQILKESNFKKDNKYIFLFCDYYNYHHMIIINRTEFINTINKNISLFQYILGCNLTAEKLLSELVDNQTSFWDSLKHNHVLIGILLGFGPQNALVCSRAEELGKNRQISALEHFPFFLSNPINEPSFGFASEAEEKTILNKMQECSRDIKHYGSYQIPCFGCIPDSAETNILLSTYEKNRNDIIQFVQQEDFLEKILERIFTTTSGEIRIPLSRRKTSLENSSELVDNLVATIRSELEAPGLDRDRLLTAFLQGAKSAEKNEEPTQDQHLLSLSEILPMQLECCKNLIGANTCFERILKHKEWNCLIPNGVAYKTLKEGKGPSSSHNLKKATFHVSFRKGNEKEYSDFKTLKKIDVERLVPGIAHALIGMKKGEQREICIHPKYAYGIYAYPLNATLFAEIHLLNFEEGEKELQILPVCNVEPTFFYVDQGEKKPFPSLGLDTLDIADLRAEYFKLLKKSRTINEAKFCQFGCNFWNLVKSKFGPIDFKTFKKQLTQSSKHFESESEREDFLKNFKLTIFVDEYTNGREPPFPLSWF